MVNLAISIFRSECLGVLHASKPAHFSLHDGSKQTQKLNFPASRMAFIPEKSLLKVDFPIHDLQLMLHS